ncbi:hypothetical protein NQ315_012448 [Exocentrus adspersus]|uniref:THAP-type domain-containing protein n=1 Tax=Exocentrus adspersus TaxID=1586481 RepID=A0AAV8VN40_9CUCU|nr:hypothetical protein NQ315_012448 [Exocentrus adspersus]
MTIVLDEPLEVVVKALSNKYQKYEVKFLEIRKCPLRTMPSYKRFPATLYMAEKWCNALGLDINHLPKYAYLCSKHFRNEDVIISRHRRYISKSAIPIRSVLLSSDTETANSRTFTASETSRTLTASETENESINRKATMTKLYTLRLSRLLILNSFLRPEDLTVK